jgi:hypothetical protein
MSESSILSLAQLLLTSTGLAAVGIGWLRSAKARGSYERGIEESISSLKRTVERLELAIGNGHMAGLKSDINEIKLSCADRMARLETMVNKE